MADETETKTEISPQSGSFSQRDPMALAIKELRTDFQSLVKVSQSSSRSTWSPKRSIWRRKFVNITRILNRGLR